MNNLEDYDSEEITSERKQKNKEQTLSGILLERYNQDPLYKYVFATVVLTGMAIFILNANGLAGGSENITPMLSPFRELFLVTSTLAIAAALKAISYTYGDYHIPTAKSSRKSINLTSRDYSERLVELERYTSVEDLWKDKDKSSDKAES